MNIYDFQKLIEKYKEFSNKLSELHDMGFDFFEGKYKLMSDVESIFELTLKSHYKEQAIDWINWFVYETNYGQKDMQGRDENGNPICYDVKSLYEYIEQYRI